MARPITGTQRGQIHAIATRHRTALLRYERLAATTMVQHYGSAWQRLRESITDMVSRYNAAVAAGEDISPSWLFQVGRWESLQRQVEMEMSRIIDVADMSIRGQQWNAVQSALQQTTEKAIATAGPAVMTTWSRLPVDAMTDLVGYLGNGSPLRTLLDELGTQASQQVRDALVRGLQLGYSPRKVAGQVRQAFGGNMARALTVSRTEMMRANREASLRQWKANDRVFSGWRWVSGKTDRTCPMCLAMDGTVHSFDEHLDDHPNGGCTDVPVLRGREDEPANWKTGDKWFEEQADATKRKILGDPRYEAYKGGKLTLQDTIGQRTSQEWGSMHYARSLKEILGEDQAKQFYKEIASD